MKLRQYGRVATATFAGALALTACGSDNNATSPSAAGAGSGAASGAASAGAGAASSAASAGAGAAGQSSGASGGSSSGASGTGCSPGTLNAEGSTAQGNAMEAWISGFQEKCQGLTVNYNATGSGAGIASFIAGKVAFAGSDSALKPEEQPQADKRCATGKALNLPMVIGPIAVAYQLQGVDNLQLSPETLAGIFSSKIKTWDDPAIAKDNPGAKLPSKPIQAFHRSDESGTTENFMKYVAAAAPDAWKFPPAKAWPGEAGGQGAAKSAGVADNVAQADGSIGYIEKSFAEDKQLGIAKLKVGQEYVQLSEQAAGKAVEAAKVTGTGNDLALKLDYATKKAGAYPLILVTYEIACEKGLAPEQAGNVKAFLTYTASQDGQGVLSESGYAPLPASLQQRVQKAVASLS